MENLLLIGTVVIIHLLGAISPGPNFLITAKNSLLYSRRTGIYTALGIIIGYLIYIFLSLTGIAIVISKSVLAFTVLKFFGAGYLIYIGIKALFAKSRIEIGNQTIQKDIPRLKATKMGLLVFLSNPKAAVLWISLFATVIPPETPISILAIMIIIMCINGFLWYSFVAVFLTQKRIRNIFQKFQDFFSRIFGGFLVLLGVKIALLEK